MTRLLISMGILVLLVALAVRWFAFSAPLPVTGISAPLPQSKNLPLPQISARHIFIWDVTHRTPLYSLDADSRIHPASTTKMMTALVALAFYPPDRVITVSKAYSEGQDIGLTPGEQITVERLLYALLVQSANDAAEVLAENYPGGRESFVTAMNNRAGELHLLHTVYQNPSGLDQDGHVSTAADLARLADEFMHQTLLARIVSAENAVLATENSNSAHILNNTNILLGKVEGVLGAKTGFTDLAGQSLVTLVNRNNHPVIISVLGSDDRFRDTELLINWVYTSFTW
ncbi:MAG: hypothetical protein UX91_C0006G0216 [Candidatus Amesbacteria bacterium GW2011_GWB1_47_19]|nr:MAG: hypothetical protein UW51_C0002G0217 [Candidatus Amesbacteria bacterium GW2011_GWA1_44_24]KKU30996.1 MAG: hypothetical protein UX46_C0008G0016 [Candidatus Amesbacteria bacterium GW2011_GWC1_46_24]KKU67154.1 MAG: hypothetical protein UX91_C0006G0216 [Candidatus Amesbacteria bacterium GW2011_GWB1_47_19]HBC73027.1 hypothetical protein [Candidatus Amesbacteria bacterium]